MQSQYINNEPEVVIPATENYTPWQSVERNISHAYFTEQGESLTVVLNQLSIGSASGWRAYYLALASLRLADVAQQAASERAALLQRALTELEQVSFWHPSFECERLTLMGYIAGQLVRYKAAFKFRTGWTSEQALHRAERLSPRNLRLCFAQAAEQLVMARPDSANEDSALQSLTEVARRFRYQRDDGNGPTWGRVDTTLCLAAHYRRRGDYLNAETFYRTALDSAPLSLRAQRGLASLTTSIEHN